MALVPQRRRNTGDEILALVHDYCDRHHLETNIELKAASPKRQRKQKPVSQEEKIPSAAISLQLYRQNKTIKAIATERSLAESTVEGHLASYVKTGELGIETFADNTAVAIITEYITSNPEASPAEIRSMLKEAYSFAQIRAVTNHLFYLNNKSNIPT